jgi:hypothetical protein
MGESAGIGRKMKQDVLISTIFDNFTICSIRSVIFPQFAFSAWVSMNQEQPGVTTYDAPGAKYYKLQPGASWSSKTNPC